MPTKHDKQRMEEEFENDLRDFGLLPCRIEYEYQARQKDEDGARTSVEVTSDYPYRRITLTVYPAFWERKRDEQSEHLKHEAVHVLLWPLKHNRLSDKAYDECEETICDVLSMVL